MCIFGYICDVVFKNEFVIYCDSKAFDKVDHNILLNKAHNLGVSGPLLKWLSSFLVGRKQSVIIKNVSSEPAPVQSGVPQGTVLGPLLFLIYINDIQHNLSRGTHLRLFVDDSLLYRQINSHLDTITLQTDLDTLQTCRYVNNKMEFHPQKCQVLHITNVTSPIRHMYNIHSTPLQPTDSAKYLGIPIDNKLTFKNYITNTTKKAHNTLSFFYSNIKNCPRKIKEQCYNVLVLPILNYGSNVWDPHTIFHAN